MNCPRCEVAELIHETRDMPCVYKSETTTIQAVTGDFCPACGAVILNREQHTRYSELLRHFQHQVNRLAVVQAPKPPRSHTNGIRAHEQT